MSPAFRTIFLAIIALMKTLPALAGNIDVIFFDDRIGTVDSATGAYTQLGTLPVSASGGIASMNGLLYVEDLGSDLYSVSPVNGSWSLIGPTGLSATSVGFGGWQDGLFEVDYSSNLYSLNPTTGNATLVGATGLVANNGGDDTSLASDGTSLYYTIGSPGGADELYRINTTTGVATNLGSTGVTGIAGSAFVNGNLELFQYGQSANYIYTAPDGSTNFTRGAQLSAQIIDGGTVVNAANALDSGQPGSVPGNTPETASNLLAGSGLLAISWLLRRRRNP